VISAYPLNDETWASVREELEQMLAHERGRLEDPSANIDATNVSRGRISAIKELLGLPAKRARLAQGIAATDD
jgi:hypothetical protein